MYQALLRYFVEARNSKLCQSGKLGLPVDVLVLEDRVLFSASPQEGGVEISNEDVLYVTGDGSDGDLLATLDSDWNELESHFRELAALDTLDINLVFIDERVEYGELLQDLLNSGNSTLEIVILDDTMDGIDQITQMLEQYEHESVSSIQIVSHGSAGALQLGSTLLSLENLNQFSEQIASWGDHLSVDADLLLFGCNVAEGRNGELFVDALSALTGADMAASDDLTGSALRGGDWDLEYQTGIIESQIAFSGDVQLAWSGVLNTIVVDTTADVVDGNVDSIDDLLNDRGDDGRISLREAILAANTDLEFDEIYFDITDPLVDGAHTISLLSELPDITRRLLIDATTDADFAGSPIVMLDGSLVGGNANGLTIDGLLASGSTIRGLGIIRFDGHGIVIENSGFNRIENNYIGVDVTGTIDQGNDRSGIRIENSSFNTIGGTINEGNVISGNERHGISITASGGIAIANVVSGNLIGTDADGTYAIGNDRHGISVEDGASNTLIGGNDSTFKNVISGNSRSGILLDAVTGTQILSNLIGTNGTGVDPIGNGASEEGGIRIEGDVRDSVIGSLVAPNVIAFNTGAGVIVEANSSFDNQIRGNSFWGNSGLAIDLKDDGPTSNDDGDSDSGPNQLQNFPIDLSTAVNVGGELSVTGFLRSNASETYSLDFYATSAGGSANDAERFIGSADVNTVSGSFWFEYTDFVSNVSVGETIRVTATDSSGNTSEMSSGAVVALSNSQPTAADDDGVNVLSGETVAIDVTNNDSDPDGDSIYILEYTQASDGTVTQTGGTELLEYTSDISFVGTDSFEYRVGDSSDNLLHYWGFNGDATDSVGSLDGIVSGAPVKITGEFADAFSFDEVDDYVEIGDFDYAGSFTVSLEFLIDDINLGGPSSSMYLYSHGSESAVNSLNISVGEIGSGSAGILTTALRDSVDAMPINALDVNINGFIGDGQWHTYTLTVESGRGASVYIDGVLAGFSEDAGNAFDPTGNLFLGARDDLGGNEFFGGGLDSVRIHDRALTTVEVFDLVDGDENIGFVSVTVTSSSPELTSADSATVLENTSFVHELTFTDPVGLTSTLSITGGDDALLFEIDGDNNLQFKVAPDFEMQADFDSNNEYLVEVTADNGDGSTSQLISIVIADVNELPTAVDDEYNVTAGTGLSTSADQGVLSNDSDQDGNSEMLLNSESVGHNGATDTNGDLIWQSESGPAGFEWDFTGGGVSYNSDPDGAPTGIGGAWVFDGTGGGTMQSLLALPGQQSGNAASFEFWIKPADIADRDVIFEIGTRLVGMSIVLDGNELQFHVDGGVFADDTLTYSGPEIVAGEYVHIVAVVDPDGAIAGGAGADIQLFVNGQLVDSATDLPLAFEDWASGMDDAGLGQSVGDMSAPAGTFFEGEIAAFRFFEGWLTQEDVWQQYAAVAQLLEVTELDGQASNVGEWTTLASGAMVRLNSDGSFDYDDNGAFEYLSDGEVISETVMYQVSDPEGLAASAQITFNVTGINESPTGIELDNTSLSENAAGAIVGSFTALDPDTADTHTWSVDDVRFEVTPAGVLKLVDGASIDFEAEESIDLQVTAVDSGLEAVVETFTISIINENDAPTDIGVTGSSVLGDVSGFIVGNVTVADQDLGDTHLLVVDDARFEIVGGELKLKVGATIDEAIEPTVTVTITATDNGGAGIAYEEAFELTVGYENDSPTSISIDNLEVSENSDGAIIGAVAVTDPDLNDAHVVTVDDARFEIVAGVLQLKTGESLDFEAESFITIELTATDSGGLSYQQGFTISVANENDSPTAIAISNNLVLENADTTFGMEVGTLSTSDQDDGETFSYSIESGFDDDKFSIVGDKLFLQDGIVDYETTMRYDVLIRSMDSGGAVIIEQITINVEDIDESPQITNVVTALVLPENSVFVTTVQAIDPEGESLSFEIFGGPDAAFFTVNVLTGELSFVGPADYDIPADSDKNNIYEVDVKVYDPADNADVQRFTIALTPTNDNAPVFVSPSTFAVHSGITSVGQIQATDADLPGDAVTYSIAGGTHAGQFTIDRVTGDLKFKNAPIHTATGNNVRRVVVAADDGIGATSFQLVKVNVENAPPVAIDDLFNVSEVGTFEGSILNGDHDLDDSNITLTIVSGPAHGSLTMNPNGTFSYTPVVGYTGTDSFVYKLTDPVGNSDTATATIHVDTSAGPLPPGGGTGGSGSGSSSTSNSDPDASSTNDGQKDGDTNKAPQAPASDFGLRSNRTDSERIVSAELLSGMLVETDESTSSIAAKLTDDESSVTQYSYHDRGNVWDLREHGGGRFDYGADTLSASGSNIDYLFSTVMDAQSINGSVDAELSSEVAGNVLNASMATVSGVVLGYVVWIVQSGVALSNVMTQLPSWKSFDPLPVLEFASESPDGDDESLEGFISRRQLELDESGRLGG